MNADFFYNVSGLMGMGSFLVIYGLLQAGKLSPEDPRYSYGNLFGAALILISLWHDFNLSAFLLEVAWALISVYGIIRYYRRKGAAQ